ncbi:ABC transporter permease [Marilutibacter maris]|uniref:ABC transporter permease n=1 Tax=Marilutibacter maris TaxID=1605891 RepID=A0A2U9TA83_9GAMM|nr:FtsX-like permease family protein [Lysobacter maris]AWV08097.1 ABC transporter permease [Lysobacter maris]
MDVMPILSSLKKRKVATVLVVAQIALCCAVLCNLMSMIGERVGRLQRDSGLDEAHVVVVQVMGGSVADDGAAIARSDLAAIQALPGVAAASTASLVPFANGAWNNAVSLQAGQQHPNLSASTYMGSEQLISAMGLELVAGREFLPSEFVDWGARDADGMVTPVPAVIVTRAVAEDLFPDASAVGEVIYSFGDTPLRVVGVVERLVRARDGGSSANYEHSILLPARLPYSGFARYVVRVNSPGDRQRVLKAAGRAIVQNHPGRILIEAYTGTLEALRENYYRKDRAMVLLLVTFCIALLTVAALGIVGLASFWVTQRTRQIGVRRALGATRTDIVRYFQTENFLLSSAGIVMGMLFAYAINRWLMDAYEMSRLSLAYLPAGALVIWLLGQVAVLLPARRAAAVPPAMATRNAL